MAAFIIGSISDTLSAGGVALFDLSLALAMGWYVATMYRSLAGGGGAVVESIVYRLLVFTSLAALVGGWPLLKNAIYLDVNNFAANVSHSYVAAPGDFSPSGILQTNRALGDVIWHQGNGGPILLQLAMFPFKLAADAGVEIGNLILAIDLMFVNISFDFVLAIVGLMLGFVVSPWLNSYAMQAFGLVIGTSVWVITVGIFVAIGQALEMMLVNLGADGTFSAMDFAIIGIMSLLFPTICVFVPAWLASKISGGSPITQAGHLMSQGVQTIRTSATHFRK